MTNPGATRSEAQFSRWLIVACAIGCAGVATLNYYVDPYGVFRHGQVRPGPAHNMRAHHIRQIAVMPVKPSTLMVGNSIMGLTEPRAIPDEARAYNASFFMARVSDLLVFFELLEANNALPSSIVVGLDPFLFSNDETEGLTFSSLTNKGTWDGHMEYRFPLPVGASSWDSLRWHADGLYSAGLIHLGSTVMDRASSIPSIDYTRSGNYTLPLADVAMQQDIKRHAGKLQKMQAEKKQRLTELDKDQLLALAQLHAWLVKRNIKATWVLQPTSTWFEVLHDTGQIDQYYATINAAMPSDAQLVDARSLLPSALKTDPSYWYDLKHYTPSLARQVMQIAIPK